jgi:hypothetical protein
MKKIDCFILVICFSIIFTMFTGCIEGSFKKTDTVLMKLDSAENVQWTSVIDNNDYAAARSLAPTSSQYIQTSDNGFFITGFFTNRSGDHGIRMLKTDREGNLVWEKRLPGQTGAILAIHQRNDGGYSMFWNDGRVYNFDASGTIEKIVNIPEQVHQIPGTAYPAVTMRSITRTSDGNLSTIMTGGDYNTLQQPVVIAGLSQNGTILWEKTYDLKNLAGTTSLIQTRDGGFIIGKFFYSNEPGGGKKILIEKTDPNTSIVWDSTLGICNYTFCNNDLLGMHESANQGYDIIYQTHEQSNASSGNPVVTVYARLDNNGQVMQQDLLTNISGLPLWLFDQRGSSLEFADMVNGRLKNSKIPENNQGNPVIRFVSLLKTDDGGYALLGTRYYEL